MKTNRNDDINKINQSLFDSNEKENKTSIEKHARHITQHDWYVTNPKTDINIENISIAKYFVMTFLHMSFIPNLILKFGRIKPRYQCFNKFFLKMNLAIFLGLLWSRADDSVPAVGCGSMENELATNILNRIAKMGLS